MARKRNGADIAVSIQVVDEEKKAVPFAYVSSSRNRHIYTTDENGRVDMDIRTADVLKVYAPEYEPVIVNAPDLADNAVITLRKSHDYEDYEHLLYTVTGDCISENRVAGAYSKVDGVDLEMNPTMSLWDALGGRLPGLFVQNNSDVPGFPYYSTFVRAPYGGTPLILIDGVERSLDYIEPETIESIHLLKDASLKSMFGGVHSNAILSIKTRRGVPYENRIRVNVQSGVEMPTRLPQYLNSADYAAYFNTALENVGLPHAYDPSKYDGTNPLLYPDVDFYDEFLNKFMTITRANAQFSGGNEKTRYFLHAGYQGNGGLEKYTDYPNNDNAITLRGNIDNTVFGFLTLSASLNAAVQSKTWPNISSQDFFGILSDTRPNEYPITIPGDILGLEDEYVLGGTSTRQDNPLGKLTRNGFVEREYSYLQSDFRIDADLDKWVKGLSADAFVTFDFYNEYSSQKNQQFSVTELVSEDGEIVGGKVWGIDSPATSLSRGNIYAYRNYMFRANVKYDRVFGKHELMALANWFMQKREFSNSLQGLKRMNAGIWLNYMYDKKYILDFSLNCVGLPSFAEENRFGCFPAVGAGWVISENDFMESADWLDYLKLRASYGLSGSTLFNSQGAVAGYYYRDEWVPSGTYAFNNFSQIVNLNQTGNPAVTFQHNNEFNAGFDFSALDNSLSGSAGYFYNKMTGGLTNFDHITPGVTGKGGALQWHNYTECESQGFEAELYYSKRIGEFEITAGGNVAYGYSEVTRNDDIRYPESLRGLSSVSVYGDTKGYLIDGIYQDEADIAGSPLQTFGNVYPGDFKYKDLNGDNIIDERDMTVIANVTPSFQYGITLNLRYKWFNLDLLGYGLAGYDCLLTNKYYQNYGDRKYSNVVRNGLPNGNPHPVLRADNSANNYVASDYWVAEGGFFKLRNAEFGFTFPHDISEKIGLNMLKLFVRGTNLFTISSIKDLDPECIDAGISNFPLCMTVTGGISFSF